MCLRTNLESLEARAQPHNRPNAKASKNSEKRKEKSRDAARCRRGKESEIFNELATTLPLPAKIIGQLDKASIMRLSIANLKTRSLCDSVLSQNPEGSVGSEKIDVEMDSLYMDAMGGFIMALSSDADIDYASENIASFLGLPQEDVMGLSLHDYIHPCDQDDVRELLSSKGKQEYRHAFLRFKCTITAKGRSVNLKSASYKVVQIRGKMIRKKESDEAWLLALCTPVPHPSNIEFPLDKQTFITKHSLDMKFTYVDDNVNEFCGYAADELMGRSLFEMHHALDNDIIKEAYKTLRSKGQVETDKYRFLARDGGYLWVVTQATLINGPKDHKPQCVVCLNYVVSGVESRGEVLSELQLRCSKSSNKKSCAKAPESAPVPVAPVVHSLVTPTVPQPKVHIQPKVVEASPAPPPARVAPAHPPPPTPVATTFKIFTPRTEEMNKGFLIFDESDPLGIVLKDEPEDLTHLAPSGGDTCVPLEVPTFIPELDDMFGLDYKQLPISSSDALFTSPTALPVNSLKQGNDVKYEEYEVTDRGKIHNRSSVSKVSIDESGCNSPPSNCGSPAGGLRTPEPPKPLLSQASLYQTLPESKPPYKGVVESSRPRTTTESLFTQLDVTANVGSSSDGYSKLDLKLEGQNMDVDEFDLRAPYIPRSNEVLMLLPDDLICQDDLMWGAHPDPVISPNSLPTSKRNLKCPNLIQEEEDSSLAQLLRDRDPPIAGPGPGKNINSGNPATGPHRNQYQQSKFLDGGGSFVDPNKVLPGHFGGKDGIDDGSGGGTLEDDLPQVMMNEQVEPPPPLVRDSPPQPLSTAKRRYSPSSSPLLAHKKMCSLPFDHQQRSLHQSLEGSQHLHQVPQMQTQSTGIRELTTPYAPTMQQLLISKEPITVRGGRPGGTGGGGGGGISAPLLSMHKGKDSVLRNLLNLSGDCEDSQNGGDPKLSTTPIRITQDRMTAMLLASGGSINSTSQLSYPKLRIVTGGQGSHLLSENHSLKMTSGCGSSDGGENNSSSKSNSNGTGGNVSGESFIKRSKRQDPFLLMDPDLTIPNLFDLSQLDYEVNAPANNSSLLQGADLLMALDQGL